MCGLTRGAQREYAASQVCNLCSLAAQDWRSSHSRHPGFVQWFLLAKINAGLKFADSEARDWQTFPSRYRHH